MKKLLLVIAVFSSVTVFSQDNPTVLAQYKDTARLGNFITRWYFDILGGSLVWNMSLTLYSDSTYRYIFHSKDCGTFNEDTKGKWKLNGNLILLDNQPAYQIIDNKLYRPDALPDKLNNVMKLKGKSMIQYN